VLRDSAELLAPAVAETLAAIPGKPEDAAARKLAGQYARVIDNQDGHCAACDDPDCGRAQGTAWAMRWLGPLLLDVLDALGATPAARSRTAKGGRQPDAAPNRLAKLRAARGA
jgi:hypothetical protein